MYYIQENSRDTHIPSDSLQKSSSGLYEVVTNEFSFYVLETFTLNYIRGLHGSKVKTIVKVENCPNVITFLKLQRVLRENKKIYFSLNNDELTFKKTKFKRKKVKSRWVSSEDSLLRLMNLGKRISFKQNGVKQYLNQKYMLKAYLDGSYSPIKKVMGYGYVVYSEGREIVRYAGVLRSISYDFNLGAQTAELEAFYNLVKWCYINQYKQIVVYYDCLDVIKELLINPRASRQHTHLIDELAYYLKHTDVFLQHSKFNEETNRTHHIAHKLSRIGLEVLY